MIKQMQSQWFLRVVIPAILSVGVCGLIFLATGWASKETDEVAAARQSDLARLTVLKLRAAIAHDQESATVWDDAVRNASSRNLEWLDTNVGAWMHTYFGHDIALVLSADRSEIYRFVADPEHDPGPANLAEAYLPLVEKLQSRLAASDTQGTNDRVLSIGEADLVHVGLRPAILSVKPIVSDTGDIEQEPGQENLHVAVRFLDGDLPVEIGREYEFTDLRFEAKRPQDPTRSFVPLASDAGTIIGYFHWTPFRPGTYVLRATAPALLLALVAIFAIASVAGGMIWRRTVRLAATRDQLLHQASHDSLTGLANRAYFNEQLARRLETAADIEKLCVLFIDLDRFKAVNDTFGHSAGDTLIAMVAARMTTLLPQALIARVGGDEFTVLLEGEQADKADVIANDIIKCLNAPFDLDGSHAMIGASVGAAIATGRANPRELTRQADIALYHSKAAGRNTYAIFGTHMDELLQKRRRLEDDLRQAVVAKTGQIQTFYQPVYSLVDGEVSSLEALARWQHPTQGYISPDRFIPLAEEMGLIHEIGSMVLSDCCRLLAQLPHVQIAVNASVLELSSPDYSSRVLSRLAASSIDPSRLEIELTESMSADEDGQFDRNINALRAAGVRFAIDDFGTGYSSFSRVQKIEADRIKIDKSFIDDLDKSDNRALVSAIISMARARGLKITAEGVETSSQREVLRSLGCDHLQGFLLSRPLPETAVRLLLSQTSREAFAV
jgi:diguanylate cyclase (GGDEF)-like protein